MNRAARAAWPALTIAVALGVPLAVVPAVAGDPSPLLLVRALLAVVFALAAATVLGAATVVVLLPQGDVRRGLLLDTGAAAAAVWTAAAAGTAFALYLDDAPAVSSASFGPGFVTFLSDVAVGRTWAIATIAGAVLTALLVAVRSRIGVAVLLVAAGGALIPVALLAATSGTALPVQRTSATGAFVQLVASGAWLGVVALLTPVGVVARRRATAVLLLLGGLTVGAVLLAASADVRSGAPAPLLAVRAGVLLLALVATIAVRRRTDRWSVVVALLLAGALGLTAAASVLHTAPTGVALRTTPAEILTGAPLPAPVTAGRLLTGWQPDPIWLLLSVVLLVAYGRALAEARRRQVPWPGGRTTAWVVGVVVLAWLTSGGPAEYQAVLLSVHLAQHVALVTAVPLLLALGRPGRLLGTLRPARAENAAPAVLLRAVPTAVLAAAGLLALYATGMLRWSASDALGTEEALLQCLLTGVLLTRAVLAADRRSGTAVTVALLVAETAVAGILAVGPGVLLPDWFGAMGWGTDAHADQRTGAVVAWAVAVAATAGLLVLVRSRGRRDDAVASPAPRRVLQDEVIA